MRGSVGYRRRLRPTARLRLTLIYVGMLAITAIAGLGVIYAATAHTSTVAVARAAPSITVTPSPKPSSGAGIATRRIAPQNVVVQQHSADLRRLLAVSLFVVTISGLASIALGWFASGRILRPLRQITATARTISAGNLGERLALQGPDDEFRQLGDTLDELLARLEAAFEAQRRFVANASHELRTPLTLERTLLQVALADPEASAARLRATCEELLASGRDQERLLEALLTLASSERGLDHQVPFDLAAVAGRVLAGVQPEIDRRGVSVVTSLDAAPAAGDPSLAERLTANLIDNAVRYNLPGGQLEVRTAATGDDVLLAVANTGPVVSPWDVERLFEPFQRLDPARTAADDGHHGLGLSIVRAIAEAHRGSVIARPRPGGGLEVTVSLPTGAHFHHTPPPHA